MKVKYTDGNVKLIVESENVSEVVQVLNLFATNKNTNIMDLTVPTPVVEKVFNKTKQVLPPVIKSENPIKNVVKPVIVNSTYENNEVLDNKSKKTVIWYKCRKCGSVSFHFGLPSDEVSCFFCKDTRPLDPVHKGSYECSCGQTSTFLIEDSVSEIPCKNKECDHKLMMIWDNATDSYIGREFE